MQKQQQQQQLAHTQPHAHSAKANPLKSGEIKILSSKGKHRKWEVLQYL